MSSGATSSGPTRNSTISAARRTQPETLRVGLTFVFKYTNEALPSLLSFFNDQPDETVGSDYMDAKNMLYLAVKSSRLPIPSIDKMIRLPKKNVYCYWEFKDRDNSSSKSRSCVSAAVSFVNNAKSYLKKRSGPMETDVGKIICVIVHDIHVGSYDGFESLPDFASSTAIGREEFWLDRQNISTQQTQASSSSDGQSAANRTPAREHDTEKSTGLIGILRRPSSSDSPHLHGGAPQHTPDSPYSANSRITASPSATLPFGSPSPSDHLRINPLKRIRVDEESNNNKLIVLDNRTVLPKTVSAQNNRGFDRDLMDYSDHSERLGPLGRNPTPNASDRGPMLHSPRNNPPVAYASSSSSPHASHLPKSLSRSGEPYKLSNAHHFNTANASQLSINSLEKSATLPSPKFTHDHIGTTGISSKKMDEVISQCRTLQLRLDQLRERADSERNQLEAERNEAIRLRERADMKIRELESELGRREKEPSSQLYSDLCAAVAKQEELEMERRSLLEELGKTTDSLKEAEESHTQTVVQLRQVMKEKEEVNRLLEIVQSKATSMEEQGTAIKGKLTLLTNRLQSSMESRKFENGENSRLVYDLKTSRKTEVDLRQEMEAMKAELEKYKGSKGLEVSSRQILEQEKRELQEELERAKTSRRDMETELSKESCMRMAAEWVILDIKCFVNKDLRLSMDSLRDITGERNVPEIISDSTSQPSTAQNETLSSSKS